METAETDNENIKTPSADEIEETWKDSPDGESFELNRDEHYDNNDDDDDTNTSFQN